MESKYKWRKIALFHTGLLLSIAATFLLTPKVFIVCALGFLFYLSWLLMFWIFDVTTSWAWGERKKSIDIKFTWLLCGAALLAIATFTLFFKTNNLNIVSGFTGLVYFFLYRALLEKINQDI